MFLSAQAKRHAHGVELLRHEVERKGHAHGARLARAVDVEAAADAGLDVVERRHAAALAHKELKIIAVVQEPLLDERADALGDERVALHLAQTQAAAAGATLVGLARQHLNLAVRGAAVDLVDGAMLETLVVGHAHKHGRLQAATRGAVVKNFVTALLEALALENGARLEEHVALLGGRKRSAVTKATLERDGLAKKHLHQLRDGHARRNGVRVDDDVGANAVGRNGHVPRVAQLAERALLPVSKSPGLTHYERSKQRPVRVRQAFIQAHQGSDKAYEVIPRALILVCIHAK